MKHLLTAVIPLFLLSVPAGAAEWEETQTAITPDGQNADLGFSARDAVVDAFDRVHLLYQRRLLNWTFEIRYTRRETDGTWSAAEVISPPGQNARDASLTIDQEGRLHAFWEDSGSGDGDIVHRQRGPDGVWETPEYISPETGASRYAVAAVDNGDRIHLVWVDERAGSRQVLYSTRDAGGAEWSPPALLSVDGLLPVEPNITADGQGAVHVVWSGVGVNVGPVTAYNVYHLRLEPGSPVDPDPVAVVTSFGGLARRPYLESMADGTLHLAWLDNRGGVPGAFEIFYKRFLPGIGWGKDKRFTYDAINHGHPVIVAGPGNTLNLVWEGYESASPNVFYRQITWETGWDPQPTRLTEGIPSYSPMLVALSTGEMVVIWTGYTGPGASRIHVKKGHVTELP